MNAVEKETQDRRVEGIDRKPPVIVLEEFNQDPTVLDILHTVQNIFGLRGLNFAYQPVDAKSGELLIGAEERDMNAWRMAVGQDAHPGLPGSHRGGAPKDSHVGGKKKSHLFSYVALGTVGVAAVYGAIQAFKADLPGRLLRALQQPETPLIVELTPSAHVWTPEPTQSGTETPFSSPFPDYTQTPVPSRTPRPKDTATALPTTDAIPRITPDQLINIDWNSSVWTNISGADYQKGLDEPPPADIVAKVTDSTKPASFINRTTAPDGSMVIDLHALLNVNLFVTRALKVDLVAGKPHFVLETWVVYPGPDGKNTLYRVNFTFVGDPIADLSHLKDFGSPNGLNITALLTEPGIDGNTDPYYTQAEGLTPIRSDFYNGIINEQTKKELIKVQITDLFW